MHNVNIGREPSSPLRRLNVPIRRQHLRSALTLDKVFTTNLHDKHFSREMVGALKQISDLRMLAGFLGQIAYLSFEYLLLLF